MCAYKIKSPLPVTEGGTTKQSFTANTVICSGTSTTGALQNVTDTGTLFYALTSSGASALPVWSPLSSATFFEPLASDPSSPVIGQVWYNTTTNLFKGARAGAGSTTWVTKSSLPASLTAGSGGGTPDDALSFGGATSPGSQVYRYTESTDSWATKTSLSSARASLFGCGLTAGDCLAYGGTLTSTGLPTGVTERYDGTGDSWTTKSSMGTAVTYGASGGDADTAMQKGGRSSVGGNGIYLTQLYDGSGDSWSTVANLNVNIAQNAGCGTSSDGLSYGGSNVSILDTTATEQYDGTANSWTIVASMNTSRHSAAGSGIVTQAYGWGGENDATGGAIGSAEYYTSVMNTWTAIASISFPAYRQGRGSRAGTAGSAIRFGGSTTIGSTNVTQILETPSVTIVTFTVT